MEIRCVKDDRGHWHVRVDNKYAGELMPDEAIGVVASTIFMGFRAPMFVRPRKSHEATNGLHPGEIGEDYAARDKVTRQLLGLESGDDSD